MTRWISLFSIVIGVVFSVGGPGKIGAIAQKTDLEFMEPPPVQNCPINLNLQVQ